MIVLIIRDIHTLHALIASLLCFDGKQCISSKAGAIKFCRERKITTPPNDLHNIPSCNGPIKWMNGKSETSLKELQSTVQKNLIFLQNYQNEEDRIGLVVTSFTFKLCNVIAPKHFIRRCHLKKYTFSTGSCSEQCKNAERF